jgi:hypothetical protein
MRLPEDPEAAVLASREDVLSLPAVEPDTARGRGMAYRSQQEQYHCF